MQKLIANLNITGNIKSKKVPKTSIKISNYKNITTKKTQFAEILGNLAIPQVMLPEIKEVKSSQPENKTVSIQFNNLGQVQIQGKNESAQISKGKVDPKGYITRKNYKVLEKSIAENFDNPISKYDKSQTLIQKESFVNNALDKNKNRGRTNNFLNIQEKISLKLKMETGTVHKSKGNINDRFVESKLQTNLKNESKADNLEISKAKNQKAKGDTADKIYTQEKGNTQDNNREIIQKSDTNLKSQVKLENSIPVNKMSQILVYKDKADTQDIDNKIQRRPGITNLSDQVKPENNIPISRLDQYLKYSQDKQEQGSTADTETPKVKTDVFNNQIVIGKGESLDMTGIPSQALEKTPLSKSQIDLIVTKMIEQIKTAPSSLEVNLKPEYLGKISILLQSNEGLVSIKVIAQNGETANVLNSSLQNIKDSLEQQGVRLQHMEVNVANQERQGNQTGYRYRRETKEQNITGQDYLIPKYMNPEPSNQISLMPYKLNLLA